jgi:hypothetical protein
MDLHKHIKRSERTGRGPIHKTHGPEAPCDYHMLTLLVQHEGL